MYSGNQKIKPSTKCLWLVKWYSSSHFPCASAFDIRKVEKKAKKISSLISLHTKIRSKKGVNLIKCKTEYKRMNTNLMQDIAFLYYGKKLTSHLNKTF